MLWWLQELCMQKIPHVDLFHLKPVSHAAGTFKAPWRLATVSHLFTLTESKDACCMQMDNLILPWYEIRWQSFSILQTKIVVRLMWIRQRCYLVRQVTMILITSYWIATSVSCQVNIGCLGPGWVSLLYHALIQSWLTLCIYEGTSYSNNIGHQLCYLLWFHPACWLPRSNQSDSTILS